MMHQPETSNPTAAPAIPAKTSLPAPLPAAPLAASFETYGMISLGFGLFYAFCFYKNPHSVTWPLFTAAGYGLLCSCLQKLGITIKKDSYFLIGTAFLLSISMALTANGILHSLNRLAMFFLLAIFLIHQFYEDRSWNIGKYMWAVAACTCTTLFSFPMPFRHAMSFCASGKSAKGKNVLIAAAGLAASVPLLFLLLILLSAADAVFDRVITSLFREILNLRTLLGISFQICAASVLFYCVLGSRYQKAISEETKDRRTGNPLAAAGFLSPIVLFYLIFCAIQVFCLFLRQGTLPESMTYAEYAHQGFFQLAFVISFNLVLVLCCLKYFKTDRILKLILTIISGCTCIMIASAAYRMILYVSCYQLTFLRLLVLWFLALVTFIMAGVFLLLRKESFPLFRYSVVVVSVFYTCFSLARPDTIIARYNLTEKDCITAQDLEYLRSLSVDAAPVLFEYLPDESVDMNGTGTMRTVDWGRFETRGNYIQSFCASRAGNRKDGFFSLRQYNYSLAKAAGIQNTR